MWKYAGSIHPKMIDYLNGVWLVCASFCALIAQAIHLRIWLETAAIQMTANCISVVPNDLKNLNWLTTAQETL